MPDQPREYLLRILDKTMSKLDNVRDPATQFRLRMDNSNLYAEVMTAESPADYNALLKRVIDNQKALPNRTPDEIRADSQRQRQVLRERLDQRLAELRGGSTMLDTSKLYTKHPVQTDSRMDERTMFPAYRENERALLEALNVTSVSLRYDATAPVNADRYDGDSMPLAGVNVTVTGTLTDRQSGLLTTWAQTRFGPLYRANRPVPAAPVAVTPSDVPVTFTETPAAK